MRTIKDIIDAEYRPIDDLITYSPLPTSSLDYIDPFLFLNHHGPQKYPHGNSGLPFGPHPHRGMETVTFILEGDILHKDSDGHESIITSGGVQWMTAGRGLIHAETSSDEFKQKGGDLEILQLWVNLPSNLKMTDPYYKGFQKEEIPELLYDEGKVKINVISGKWNDTNGAYKNLTGINISLIYFQSDGQLPADIPIDENIFFYVIKGRLIVNDNLVKNRQLISFNNDAREILIKALDEAIIIFGHAKPFNEKVVAQGPFVMNSEDEIEQAYNDYRKGKFGKWIY